MTLEWRQYLTVRAPHFWNMALVFTTIQRENKEMTCNNCTYRLCKTEIANFGVA